MKTPIRAFVLTLAVAATTLTTFAPAHADDWRRRHHNRGDAAAIGALGLGAGLIIGGALASQPRYRERERVYIDPDDGYYEEPEYRVVRRPRRVVESYGSLEPWSPAWYRWCSNRYQSFNPDSGTFRGYDGRDHFCTAG